MKTKWWLFIVWLSFRWAWRTTLFDYVIWKGNMYIITNGVPHNTWTLRKAKGKGIATIVMRSEVKKIWSLMGCIRSFKRGYDFYMGYWFDIWCRKGIRPWMKECNIW